MTLFAGETVYARGLDNILLGGTVSGTTPSTSYSLSTLVLGQPAARVRFGATSVAITVTLASPKQGDVLAWPWTNLTVPVVVTNGAGLSVSVPAVSTQANGIPLTTVIDLTVAEPNATTRTSNTWTFTVTSNGANVILGGALSIFGPKRVLSPDLRFGFKPRKQHQSVRTPNEYGTLYVVDYQTAIRSLAFTLRTQDLAGWEAWFDEMAGGTQLGLLWPQITGLDAYLGIFDPSYEVTNVEGTDYVDIAGVFTELSKGKPV